MYVSAFNNVKSWQHIVLCCHNGSSVATRRNVSCKEKYMAGMISEMEKSLFNSPGPPLTQPGGVPATQVRGHPAHTVRICSSLEEPLCLGSTPDDHDKSFLEVCSWDEDQSKKPNMEVCSILYGPENLNTERCSSLLPGTTLCLPSNCSLSPICRNSLLDELDVPMDLEDNVFLSPVKSGFAPSATSETTAPETIVVTTGIIPVLKINCGTSNQLNQGALFFPKT